MSPNDGGCASAKAFPYAQHIRLVQVARADFTAYFQA
jgi:hypothetical protein